MSYGHPCMNHAACLSGSAWVPSRCKKCQNAFTRALQTDPPNKSSNQLIKWAHLVKGSLSAHLVPGSLILPKEEESFLYPWLKEACTVARSFTPKRKDRKPRDEQVISDGLVYPELECSPGGTVKGLECMAGLEDLIPASLGGRVFEGFQAGLGWTEAS